MLRDNIINQYSMYEDRAEFGGAVPFKLNSMAAGLNAPGMRIPIPRVYRKVGKYGGLGLLGLGGIGLANRYLNPNSRRNQRIKAEEQAKVSSPVNRLRAMLYGNG